MVDRVRAFDKGTKVYSGIVFAAEVKPEDRHKFDYKCPNTACSCSLHFRNAAHAHENTEHRPKTFVKNPSSEHVAGCRFAGGDYIVTHEQVSYDGDLTKFRIQFPMGMAPSDINPEKNLSQAQKQAARSHASKRGFKSLRDLVDFIERKKHGLDSIDVREMTLLYQGESHDWDKLFVSSQAYARLLRAAKDDIALIVAKPEREISPSPKGKPRFVCETQYTKHKGRNTPVKPILVLGNHVEARHIHRVIERNETLLIASRIFHNASEHRQPEAVYLNVGQNAQLARIDTVRYWHSVAGPQHQMSLGFNRS